MSGPLAMKKGDRLLLVGDGRRARGTVLTVNESGQFVVVEYDGPLGGWNALISLSWRADRNGYESSSGHIYELTHREV